MTARAARCDHCCAALAEEDQTLHTRYDKIEIPKVKPVVTRLERYTGHRQCCGGMTLAPLPDGLEQGTPFSINIVALAPTPPAAGGWPACCWTCTAFASARAR